ncbi:hypothetical protein [Caulobacter segnis]
MSDYRTDGEGFIGELGGDLPPREVPPNVEAAEGSAKAAVAAVKAVAETAIGEAREQISTLTSEAAETVRRRYGDLEAWAHLNPARALGIAAGVGVVLGLLLRGRSTHIVYGRDR